MKHFFDIGANNGSTFDRFLIKTTDFDGQRVWCFEPSPQSWPALQQKAELMAARFQITLCPFGFGLSGVFPFYLQRESEGDTFIADSVAFTGQPAVPAAVHFSMVAVQYPLSQFILKQTWREDTITLKLDCEGSEYIILKDLLETPEALRRCDRIMVEWHNVRSVDFHAERELLESRFHAAGHALELWPY